jgi:hypothetical protein
MHLPLFDTTAAICIRRATGLDKMAQFQGLGRGEGAQPDGLLPKVRLLWRLRCMFHRPAASRASLATPVPGLIAAGEAAASAN